MKKLLLSLVALMSVVCVNAQEIKFVVDEVQVPKGGSVVVPINIENTIDCYSWEALIGVEGVSVINGDIKFSKYALGERGQNIHYTKITWDEETGEELGREDVDDGAFSIESTTMKVEDGIYNWKIIGFNTGGFCMKDNSGPIAYITFTAPETVEIGETYTGYMDEIHFGKADGTDLAQEKFTFNIKIVENVYVLDETSTTAPIAGEYPKVQVNRTIKANEWGTLCLPFNMSEAQVKSAFGEDVALANFAGWTAEEDDEGDMMAITINFSSCTTIAANTPLIIKPTSDITSFTVEEVNIAPNDAEVEIKGGDNGKRRGKMIGVYEAGTELDEDYLFLSGNKFYYSNGTTKMKAFRAYFDLYNSLDEPYRSSVSGSPVKMAIYDDPTAINSIDSSKDIKAVYTIDGKKMNNTDRLPKGVYIIDGKKVAIK